MPVKLFVLGRPGAGKSHAARYIADYLKKQDNSSIHINDYRFLYAQFRKDTKNQGKRFHSDERGGFVIDDEKVFDEALEYIKRKAINDYDSGLYDFVIIEFARSDYSIALQAFDPEFLQDAYFLFIDADVETCINRLNRRINRRRYPDDHHIAEEVVKKFYTRDNRLYMMVGLMSDFRISSKQAMIIDNRGSKKAFRARIIRFTAYLIALEKEARTLRDTDPIQITVARPYPEIAN